MYDSRSRCRAASRGRKLERTQPCSNSLNPSRSAQFVGTETEPPGGSVSSCGLDVLWLRQTRQFLRYAGGMTAFVLIAGYVVGFVVVNYYLASYGVRDLEPIRRDTSPRPCHSWLSCS